MLDLFPNTALQHDDAFDWRRQHRFFDISALRPVSYAAKYASRGRVNPSNDEIVVYHGGIRGAKFGVDVCLTKHPLVSPPSGTRLVSSHHLA